MMEALRAVEQLVLDKTSFEFREELGVKASHLVYDGRWFTPLRKSIMAAADELAQDVNGEVVVKLYKGQATVTQNVQRTASTQKSLPPLVPTRCMITATQAVLFVFTRFQAVSVR